MSDGEGITKKVIRASSTEASVFSFRVLLAVLAFICAGLSGFIANTVVQQGQTLAILVDSRARNLQKFDLLVDTVGAHTAAIASASVQEKQDTAYLQEQISQILAKLDDINKGSTSRFEAIQEQLDAARSSIEAAQQKLNEQDTKITNLGMAVARIRGASHEP